MKLAPLDGVPAPAGRQPTLPDITSSPCYISYMSNKTITKISELTSQLPETEREAVESKLMQAAETLVAAYRSDAAARDRISERSLKDITAGRVVDLAEFDKRMDLYMDELDHSARL